MQRRAEFRAVQQQHREHKIQRMSVLSTRAGGRIAEEAKKQLFEEQGKLYDEKMYMKQVW